MKNITNSIFWSVAGIIIISQVLIFFATKETLSRIGMTDEFYKQEAKRDSLYEQYSVSADIVKKDSITRATRIDNFINHAIPDGKDLGKTFLTLLTAVLVATITFGEKVVQFSTAPTWAKVLLISSWISISIAIALCGLGLVYLMASCPLPLRCNHLKVES